MPTASTTTAVLGGSHGSRYASTSPSHIAATALALACAVAGVRARARLLAPVAAEHAWQAALAGGLAAGVVGALSEDSGPVLLVVAMLALACVTIYLWGRPPARPSSSEP